MKLLCYALDLRSVNVNSKLCFDPSLSQLLSSSDSSNSSCMAAQTFIEPMRDHINTHKKWLQEYGDTHHVHLKYLNT